MIRRMDTTRLLSEIEAEIARLQRVAKLLRGDATPSSGRGKTGKRRILSRKARKAIADAQRARWARVRAERKKKE